MHKNIQKRKDIKTPNGKTRIMNYFKDEQITKRKKKRKLIKLIKINKRKKEKGLEVPLEENK